jgi:putative ABC transport system permease protein
MEFYLTALLLGLGFSSLGIGIFVSMRIFRIPDITTDGSFTLGAVVTAVGLAAGLSPYIALPAAAAAGFVSGTVTGFIHTRLRVNPLLAGVLVMTALYSVNLAILQRPNLPLMSARNIFDSIRLVPGDLGNRIVVMFLLVTVIATGMYRLLRTDFGLAMRATGNNETMMRSLSTNTDRMKRIGLGLANALVALSGSLITQLQGYADINMGIGIVILGLGSVVIGEMLAGPAGSRSLGWRLTGVIAGTVVFRVILALALASGINPVYLKLVVAALVLAAISIPAGRRGAAVD